jgi:hypothetical protein
MATETVTIKLDLATAALLRAKAAAEGSSLADYIRRFVEDMNGMAPPVSAPSEENTAYNIPDFGAYLLEKHNQEQRRFLALQKIAAQQGVTAAEWVRQQFPNGRDNLGRSLTEFLDTLISDTALLPNDTH